MKKIWNLQKSTPRNPPTPPNRIPIFLLVRLISSYIVKISLLACLVLEIAMEKTLKLVFGRRHYKFFNFFLNILSRYVSIKLQPKHFPNCFLNFSSSRFKSSYIPEINNRQTKRPREAPSWKLKILRIIFELHILC